MLVAAVSDTMNLLTRAVSSVVVAALLAVLLTRWVFNLPPDSQFATAAIAAVVAVVIVFLNRQQPAIQSVPEGER
jgi:uncharacterized membrane protein YgaE (UPF0421/DUF939 family)